VATEVHSSDAARVPTPYLYPSRAMSGVTGVRGERAALIERGEGVTRAVRSGCVHDWVAAQAAATPVATAVEHNGEQLSYGELLRRADGMAGQLAGAGVGPGVPVGVSMGPSVDLVVAMLGVLLAGGVYLPLDPAYPAPRRDAMVADAGAALVLESAAALPGCPAGEVRRAEAADAAYIIFTSGSTGRPKGVLVGHAGLANLAEVVVDLYGYTSSSPRLAFLFDRFRRVDHRAVGAVDGRRHGRDDRPGRGARRRTRFSGPSTGWE